MTNPDRRTDLSCDLPEDRPTTTDGETDHTSAVPTSTELLTDRSTFRTTPTIYRLPGGRTSLPTEAKYGTSIRPTVRSIATQVFCVDVGARDVLRIKT